MFTLKILINNIDDHDDDHTHNYKIPKFQKKLEKNGLV